MDLFNLLEQSEKVTGFLKVFSNGFPLQTLSDYAAIVVNNWYDLSFVYGDGLCVPTWLHDDLENYIRYTKVIQMIL